MTQENLSQKEINGKNLKNLLRHMNYTQETLAGLLFVDERTVGRWVQNGIDKISLLEDIAEVLGVGLKDIMFPEKED